jgi:hypothetical protein
MKKEVGLVISVFIFILVLTSLVSAVTVDLKKSSLSPGETLQVEVTGNFLTTLTKDNFGIYLGNSAHESPVESGLIKSEGKYLFYALVPNVPGSYSLKIEDIEYIESSVQKTDSIVKNFTIVSNNASYISFNPGYIYATESISLVIQAYNADQDIVIELPSNGYKTTTKVFEGQTTTVVIPITGISGVVKTNIKVGSYSIPAVIVGNSTQTPVKVNSTRDLEDLLDIDPNKFELTLLEGYENSFEFEIINIYGEFVDLVLNSSNSEIKLNKTKLNSFSGREVIEFKIKATKDFDGYINISSENDSRKIPILVKVTKNKTQVNYSTAPINVDRTCKAQGGVSSCAENQVCDRETTASDGYCCLSGCKTKSGSSGWIWGIILILILVVGGWYFYDKYKKSPQNDKTLEKRTELYKHRMSPGVEVTRGLGKD